MIINKERNNMRLRDIPDFEDYLENRCYCPHEIYDDSGFFFNLFYPDQECIPLGQYDAHGGTFKYVIADDEYGIAQILAIYIEGGKVVDCVRFDATKHNIDQVRQRMRGDINCITVDEYPNRNLRRSLEELLSIVDFVIKE